MGARASKKKEDAPEDIQKENDATTSTNPFRPNNRKCTDLLCFLFFILFWIGMVVIAGVAYNHGDPARLVYGTDWKGRICGNLVTEAQGNIPAYDLRDYPYLIYPRLSKDLLMLETTGEVAKDKTSLLKKLYGVCVDQCPSLEDHKTTWIHAYYDYSTKPKVVDSNPTSKGQAVEDELAGSPWQLAVGTTEILYRCVAIAKVEVHESARCVDACTTKELNDYNANTIDGIYTQLTCGYNLTINPMRDCGQQDCTDYILAHRPNCTSIEKSTLTTQTDAAQNDPVTSMLSQEWHLVARWIGDVQKSAFPILICGGLLAALLGFFWLILLRFCAGLFVWLVVILVLSMQIAITFFTAYQGNLLGDDRFKAAMNNMGMSSTLNTLDDSMQTMVNASGWQTSQDGAYYWRIACYISIAIDVVLAVLLIFMCSRIRVAIGIIREASKAMNSMPSITLFPLLPSCFAIGLVIYWVIAAAFIATCGDVTLNDVRNQANAMVGTPPIENEVKPNSVVNYLLIYHLFGLLWTSQFIQFFSYTTIAGAFCEYYWTLDKRTIRPLSVCRSWWRTLRYHMGSVAFGALLIAIVQMIRIALEYVDQKMRSTKQGNAIVRVVMMCMRCCLWCFEKCLKFLNNNAFIMIAMKGSSFCGAMKDSFTLLFANAARVATVSIISKFLMLMGKLFITCFAMFFVFLFIRYPPSNVPSFYMGDLEKVSSPVFPMLVTGVLAFGVGSYFLDIYATAIDTILLCFCEDCNVNKSSGAYYMSDELLAYIDGPAKKNAFNVYQGTRDVSHRSESLSGGAVPPIMSPK